jgi:hypothetical protein
MRPNRSLSILAIFLLAAFGALARSDEGKDEVKEKALDAPHNIKIKVRMEGPYTADVSLQVVCYFKYTPEGARKMSGAPVELDKHLGGVIGSLRERGEFVGDQLETILIIPPKNSIKAKALLRRARGRGRFVAETDGGGRPSVAAGSGSAWRQSGCLCSTPPRSGKFEG